MDRKPLARRAGQLKAASSMTENPLNLYFRLFNEIGIIGQLSRSLLEAHLPPRFLLQHFAVLNHLVRVKDGQMPLHLARAFQVPKTSMTHTLAILAKAGLVELRDNPDDGRSKCVWITEAGKAFRRNAIDNLAPDITRLVAKIPAGHIETLLPLLTELRCILDTDRDEV